MSDGINQDGKSASKYKVTPSEEISSDGNKGIEDVEGQHPGKKKSFFKSITDDTAVFIHEIQNNVSNSIQKATSVKVNFKFHGPELPDEDDFKELRQKLSKVVKVASWCFDSSVENFPIGGAIGLGITIFSCVLISGAVYRIRSVVFDYDTEGVALQYIGYYVFGIIFFIAVHSAVFLHGISVGIVETERELCGKTDAGYCCFNSCCCCCKKHSKCGFCCKILEKFAQRGCQLIWAILGTGLLLAIYVVGLVLFLVSTLTASASYGLTYSCGLFENLLKEYIKVSNDYIAIAKLHLNSADSVISEVLESYSAWNNLQDKYSNSAVGQLGEASGIAAGGTSAGVSPPPSTPSVSPGAYSYDGRRLASPTSFDPKVSLAKGQSMVQVLNASIFDTERQLVYYEEQSKVVIKYCKDVSSLYDAFLYILIASVLLLFSELIMFSVHTKYFTAWNYEMELMDQENERKKLERQVALMHRDAKMQKGASGADSAPAKIVSHNIGLEKDV